MILSSVSPTFADIKKSLVLWGVYAPGPTAESSMKHQVNCAFYKSLRNSPAQGSWETLV